MSKDRIINRRRYLAGLGAATGVGMFAGCIGDDPDPDPGDADTPDPGDEDTPEPDVEFPTERMTGVITSGPGGGFDTEMRGAVPHLQEELGVDIQAFNIHGAGGRIGQEQVYESEGEAHTFLILNVSNGTHRQVTIPDIGFDMRNYTYYAQVSETIRGIVVGNHTDIHTLEDYVEAINSDEPPRHSYDIASLADSSVMGVMTDWYDIDPLVDNVVTGAGMAEAQQMLIAGHTDAVAASWASLRDHVLAGNTRPLILLTNNPDSPEIRSEEEEEIDTFVDWYGWEGLDEELAVTIEDMIVQRRIFVGPPGVADGPAEILREAFFNVIHNDEFLADMEAAGRNIVYRDHEDSKAAVTRRLEAWMEQSDLIEALE